MASWSQLETCPRDLQSIVIRGTPSWQPSWQVRAAGLPGFHYPGQGVAPLEVRPCHTGPKSEIRRHKVVSEGTSPFMQAESWRQRKPGVFSVLPIWQVRALAFQHVEAALNGIRVEGLSSEISRPKINKNRFHGAAEDIANAKSF